MAEFNVELAELQKVCDYFVEAEYPYFEELREAFKLLRLTGCRIQELFDISRWTIISGYTVQLQPQKGNNPRTIILNSDFDNFISAIQGQFKPFLGRTYSQLEYLFLKINPYGKLYSGARQILNYAYRYLYIRELAADGLTNEQIAVIMGHVNPTVILNYLNAPLTSTIEIPVTNLPDFYDDIIQGFIMDDDQTSTIPSYIGAIGSESQIVKKTSGNPLTSFVYGFNGVNSQGIISFPINSFPFSIQFWLNPQFNQTGFIIGKNSYNVICLSPLIDLFYFRNNIYLRVWISKNNASVGRRINKVLALNSWYRIVVNYISQNPSAILFECYINSELITSGSLAASGYPIIFNDTLSLGCQRFDYLTYNQFGNFNLSFLNFTSKTLTQSEVDTDFNNSSLWL
jgi:hypothetical protein